MSVFIYLKNCDENQSYWFAVGSNQQMKDSNNVKFVKKAKEALEKLENAENKNEALPELLGKDFPKEATKYSEYASHQFRNTEQFIENMLRVDIQYDVKLECNVTQDGWRPTLLITLLRSHSFLRKNKSLDFYIETWNPANPH